MTLTQKLGNQNTVGKTLLMFDQRLKKISKKIITIDFGKLLSLHQINKNSG